MSGDAIHTKGLTVALGERTVLRDASLCFERGRVTAVLGPNGAGKTSLIRALTGVIPYGGDAFLGDSPLSALPLAERGRRIGYLPQDGSPAWDVTVRELVGLGRLPHRSAFAGESDADRTAISAALEATDTAHLTDRTIGAISGGERARVKIARVLAGEPDWIFADEPLANLDPPHQRDVLALFRSAAARGTGVVVILHQLNAALRVADNVVLLRDGAALAAGARDEVMTPDLLEAVFDMGFALIGSGKHSAIVPKQALPSP